MIYSTLNIRFVFRREIGFSIVQIYIPATLLVIVCYCSFWLGYDAAAGRLSLCITSLLALFTQFGSLRQRLPPVSYITVS